MGTTGFQASPELSAALQRVLVDLIELHLQGKQAHWNVVGLILLGMGAGYARLLEKQDKQAVTTPTE